MNARSNRQRSHCANPEETEFGIFLRMLTEHAQRSLRTSCSDPQGAIYLQAHRALTEVSPEPDLYNAVRQIIDHAFDVDREFQLEVMERASAHHPGEPLDLSNTVRQAQWRLMSLVQQGERLLLRLARWLAADRQRGEAKGGPRPAASEQAEPEQHPTVGGGGNRPVKMQDAWRTALEQYVEVLLSYGDDDDPADKSWEELHAAHKRLCQMQKTKPTTLRVDSWRRAAQHGLGCLNIHPKHRRDGQHINGILNAAIAGTL